MGKMLLLLAAIGSLIATNMAAILPAEREYVQRGDILFPPEFFEPGSTRNGWNSGGRWSGGVVPYTLDSTFTSSERQVIAAALNEISSQTCIRFKVRTNEVDFVSVLRNQNRGCSSYFGRIGNAQPLWLDAPGCIYQGTIAHEFIHAIGFTHEQSRPDRDDWISIDYSNIISGYEGNFDKYSTSQVNTYGVPYDYGSVMHYGRRDFAKDRNKDVITPKNSWGEICGSCSVKPWDALKINRMYEGIC